MTVATLPPGIRRHRGKYQVRYYGSDGRERARSFARLTDAKTFKASVTTDKARGEWHDSRLGRVRLSEYARQWAETKGNVNERTRINIEGRLRNHITPTFGTSPLSSIEPQDVRSWITDLKARGLAPSTVRATYRTFGQIMRTAEVDGLIRRSPCVGVELPAETSHDEMHFLTEEQVVRLAEAISARYRCAILMDAYTGLRAGELWALTLQRVDMLRGVVDVAESLSEVRGALVTGPTKTRARRSVTLPRFLVETIGEHLAEFPSSAYLFTSADGGPVRHRNFMRRHFKRAVRNAGLPEGLRFHDLRHTCAAVLIGQDWNPKQIQQRLGHSSIRTTLDRYGHLFEGHDARLLEGLDDGFREASLRTNADQKRTAGDSVTFLDASRGPQ